MTLIIPFGGTTPTLDPTAWVAPNATLIGSVILEANSSVFYGTVLRGDNDSIRLGAGSNIQDNVAMHTDVGKSVTIGTGVSVGHGAILHGCTIENDSLIGMGAIVLNGAIVGEGSLIAAGAVVRENAVIPAGSMVAGVPGKIIRELSADEREGLKENARHYLELAAAHRIAVFPLT